MKKQSILWALVPFLVIVSNCTAPLDMIWYNHTGKDLTVYVKDRSFNFEKDSRITLKDSGTGQTVKLSDGNKVWEYKIVYPPQEYFQLSKWAGYEIHCQIEPQGFIYILKPQVTLPILELPPQPDGYPLRPI